MGRESIMERGAAQQAFEAELAQVDQLLHAAVADLFPPFSQLVAAQAGGSLRRAAIVLAAGMAEEESPRLCEQRVALAAALEMLHRALAVHMRVGSTSKPTAPNLTLLGSTILAGDYCFSRAAGLAVRTGEAAVVEIFADALKRVSEGHLRQRFDGALEPYDEDSELFRAGATAAMRLTRAAEETQQAILELVAGLAARLSGQLLLPSHALTPAQLGRWQVLLQWWSAHPAAETA
ncbi:MAG: polyprenyl synthetase family protein [Chloroflexi bacterium]|nr:polyprenyl synthetase family protein [Chloroflexota bacterium]